MGVALVSLDVSGGRDLRIPNSVLHRGSRAGWLARLTTNNNKLAAHHPARGSNLDDHTKQEAHDAPWFGARGLNTGPGLAIPGGALLCHSCYGKRARSKLPYIYGIDTKTVKALCLFVLNFSCCFSCSQQNKDGRRNN